jgi:multidrug efflux pump subunit AcrA (membrane-fusion protein)
MNCSALIRSLLLVVVMAAVSAALLFTSVLFRGAARARDVPIPAPASGGIACFGTVDLEHGVTSLDPLQPGRVAEVLVGENQVVALGAEILRLDDAAPRIRLAEADAAVELSRLQLQQARKLPAQQTGRITRQQ